MKRNIKEGERKEDRIAEVRGRWIHDDEVLVERIGGEGLQSLMILEILTIVVDDERMTMLVVVALIGHRGNKIMIVPSDLNRILMLWKIPEIGMTKIGKEDDVVTVVLMLEGTMIVVGDVRSVRFGGDSLLYD